MCWLNDMNVAKLYNNQPLEMGIAELWSLKVVGSPKNEGYNGNIMGDLMGI